MDYLFDLDVPHVGGFPSHRVLRLIMHLFQNVFEAKRVCTTSEEFVLNTGSYGLCVGRPVRVSFRCIFKHRILTDNSAAASAL